MYDIELALVGLPKNEAKNFVDKLPNDYVLDDKYELGWGSVVRGKFDLPDDIGKAIDKFLSGLSNISGYIRENKSILRVAVFNRNLTYTFRIDSTNILMDFGVGLEVSVYPAED